MNTLVIDDGNQNIQVNTVELGHATDTTISRTSAGVINVEGDDVLMNSGIGVTIQAYDADTAKYDDTTANFTGTLQEGGNDVITDADTASDTTAGIVELATAAETTTGTDTGRAVTPDGLAGSDFGIRLVQAQIVEGATDVATGDGTGNFRFFVPEELNGYNLVSAHAAVVTAGTTGTTDIQIHNVTDTADMLSTKITIDSGEKTSYTAATPPVIDGTADDVATGDEIRVDVDSVSTTAPKGLSIILGFQLG